MFYSNPTPSLFQSTQSFPTPLSNVHLDFAAQSLLPCHPNSLMTQVGQTHNHITLMLMSASSPSTSKTMFPKSKLPLSPSLYYHPYLPHLTISLPFHPQCLCPHLLHLCLPIRCCYLTCHLHLCPHLLRLCLPVHHCHPTHHLHLCPHLHYLSILHCYLHLLAYCLHSHPGPSILHLCHLAMALATFHLSCLHAHPYLLTFSPLLPCLLVQSFHTHRCLNHLIPHSMASLEPTSTTSASLTTNTPTSANPGNPCRHCRNCRHCRHHSYIVVDW